VDIITQADTVIINGDFWDGYICTLDDFINSPWKALFPILKQKNTIYIPGNHDAQGLEDNRVMRFCDEVVATKKLEIDGINLHIEHGHNIYHLNDTTNIPDFLIPMIAQGVHFFHYWMHTLTHDIYFNVYQRMNNSAKSWMDGNVENEELLCTGHTHLKEADPEHNFYNSGYIQFGHGSYIEIVDGSIKLITSSY